MDWSNALSAVVGGVLMLIATKIWKDLLPEKRIFTPRSTIIGGMVIAFILAGWPMIQMAQVDSVGGIIAKTVLWIIAFSTGISALVAAICGYHIFLLRNRVAAIEKHVRLS